LTKINNNGAVKELLKYNQERYSISIPYQYYMDRLSIGNEYSSGSNPIPTDTATTTDIYNNNSIEGVVKGEKGYGELLKLYEENIGIVTPIVAEKLKSIAGEYPQGWFGAAMDEAVSAGVRNLKYIKAILKRWHEEGFKTPKGSKGKDKRFEGSSNRDFLLALIYRGVKSWLGKEPPSQVISKLRLRPHEDLAHIRDKLKERIDEGIISSDKSIPPGG